MTEVRTMFDIGREVAVKTKKYTAIGRINLVILIVLLTLFTFVVTASGPNQGTEENSAIASYNEGCYEQPAHDPALISIKLESSGVRRGEPLPVIVELVNLGVSKQDNVDLKVLGNGKIVYERTGVQINGRTEFRFNINGIDTNSNGLVLRCQISSPEDSNLSNNATVNRYRVEYSEKENVQFFYKNERPNVHGWTAFQAQNILPSSALKTELSNNFLGGVADPEEYWACLSEYVAVPDNWSIEPKNGSSILEGTWEEDEDFYDIWPYYSYFYHFWDPDIAYNDGLAGYDSALVKAQYWWDEAKNNYWSNQDYSYYCLGRVIHLLGDMGIPDHVHKDPHTGSPDSISNYEEYTKLHFNNYTGSGTPKRWQNPPLNVPYSIPSNFDPELAQLFYNMAQFTQYFDSSEVPGNSTPFISGLSCNYGSYIQEYAEYAEIVSTRVDANGAEQVFYIPFFGSSVEWYEGTQYDRSRGAGYVYVVSDTSALSCLKLVYHDCDTKLPTPEISDILDFGTYHNVPDRLINSQATIIMPENIRFIAGLYELFWSNFHWEPLLQAPSSAASGSSYQVSWTSTSPVPSYELQEATNPSFTGATTYSLAGTTKNFVHTVSSATTYYYKVRSLKNGNWSDWSNIDQTIVNAAPSGSITIYNLVANPSTISSRGTTTISGNARYNTGTAVPNGTATITVPGGDIYTAAVSSGAFTRTITGPPTSSNVSVTVSDGTLSGSSSVYVTVTESPTGNSYTLTNDIVKEAWDDGSNIYRTPKDAFRSSDSIVYAFSAVTDANLSTPVDYRYRFYYPAGTQYGSDLTGRLCEAYWDWSYVYWGYYISGNSMMYNPGRYTVKFYTNDNDGQGWRYKDTQYYTMAWDLTEHRMCKDVGGTAPYEPITPTNVFLSTDVKAMTWANFDLVAQPIELRWDFIEPSGATYNSFTHTTTDPGIDSWYSSVRTWGYIYIQGNQAAQKCGDWAVNVFVKNPGSGSYEQRYTDSFKILETPAVAPSASLSNVPASPSACQTISLSVSASDNTLLKKVVVYWNNGTLQSQTIDNIFQSTYSGSINIGSYTGGTALTYYCTALDTSGNVMESTHQSLTVRNLPAPGAPNFASVGCTSIAVEWGAISDTTVYDLWRFQGACGGAATKILSNTTATSYNNTGLASLTQYSYYVVAKNGSCSSANGYCNSTTTLGVSPAPTDISISGSCSGVTINWAPSSGASSYTVQRGNSCGTAIASFPNVVSPYLDTTGAVGATYQYWVVAVNSCGTSSASACGSGTSLSVPEDDVVITPSSDKNSFVWTGGLAGAYRELRGTLPDLINLVNGNVGEDSCKMAYGLSTSSVISSDDPQMEIGRFYWYIVQGYNGSDSDACLGSPGSGNGGLERTVNPKTSGCP